MFASRSFSKHRFLVALFLVLTFFFGCRTAKEIPKSDLSTKAETQLDSSLLQLFERSMAGIATFKTMHGYGSMQIRTPEMNQRLNCTMRIKRGEAMQLTGSIFFGITAFDALLRTDSVFLYSPLEKRLYLGENSPANLQRITGLSANFSDLIDAFLGLPRIDTATSFLYKASVGDGKVAFFLKNGELDEVIEVDSATASVESLRLIKRDGKTLGAIFFSSFEPLPRLPRPLPKEVELVAYDYTSDSTYTSRQVFIRYSEREVNPENFAFTFAPSKKATVYRIEQLQMRFR
ncbi:MAG: DUF4292 domain-containing protein [Chloroherpetonaceae bacterium]